MNDFSWQVSVKVYTGNSPSRESSVQMKMMKFSFSSLYVIFWKKCCLPNMDVGQKKRRLPRRCTARNDGTFQRNLRPICGNSRASVSEFSLVILENCFVADAPRNDGRSLNLVIFCRRGIVAAGASPSRRDGAIAERRIARCCSPSPLKNRTLFIIHC